MNADAGTAQAMILAAGLGTRLWPLTADRAKPAVPFAGRPLVAGIADLARRHGLSPIVANTHYRPESVRAALAGDAVRISHEPEILGTAGALAAARDAGHLIPGRAVVILNGKLVTDLDLGRAVAAHSASGAAVTMLLRQNRAREAFREVVVDGDRVVGFGAGRVPEGPNPALFTGIHVLDWSVVEALAPVFSDTVADIYPPLIAAGRVHALFDDAGEWAEFSTLERYLGLHLEAMRAGRIPRVVAGEQAEVAAGADVDEAILWEGARIDAGARVRRAVLGAGVHLAAGAEVADAVVVRRELVGAVERGVVLGEHVHVPLA